MTAWIKENWPQWFVAFTLGLITWGVRDFHSAWAAFSAAILTWGIAREHYEGKSK